MEKFFSYKEYVRLLNYGIFESLTDDEIDDKSIIKKSEKDSPSKNIHKDKDDNEITKTDKSQMPKDKQVKDLAKELYIAQLEVLKIQADVDDTIIDMTKADPEDPVIAQLTATLPVMIANAMSRVAAIEQQMSAVASGNEALTSLVSELAGESKNLAFKKAIEEFGEKVKKYRSNAEKILKDKAKEEKEKEKDSKDDKEVEDKDTEKESEEE